MEGADFSGYATKANLRCTDGRTIMPDAFKHQDKMQVPLVWAHDHSDPEQVLGHAILEARTDGIYCHGFFNESPKGQAAKALVHHNDVKFLSIWANQLVEKTKQVFHGAIREVSLVLAGANPGAMIEQVHIAHADGGDYVLEDEAIIYTGLEIEHADASASTRTLEDVYNDLDEEEQALVHYMVDQALKASALQHGDDDQSTSTEGEGDEPAPETQPEDAESDGNSDDATSEETSQETSEESSEDTTSEDAPSDDSSTTADEGNLAHQEGIHMNVFENQGQNGSGTSAPTLSHDQLKKIVADAKRMGSFKEAFLAHAEAENYGVGDIDLLFPDARALTNSPEMISRKQEWVTKFFAGVKKSPFSRIKTLSADLTLDEARAKGYVKGSYKKEEFFALQKRVTNPTTIYKKQKLDREDIVDITDLDVVAWLKAEMRMMLDEEIARAALVGDGREIDDDDKIDETAIRPIAYEDDFFAHKVTIAANTDGDDLVEAILRARPMYRGTGTPTLFVTEALLTDLLLVKDKMGRRLYASQSELAFTLRVADIVTVPVMETTDVDGGDLLAILVNLADYTMGADRGGEVTMFDDFDIDYNQYKYLMEARLSGALTKFKSALVFLRGAGTLVSSLTAPTFNTGTGVVTIPSVTGVVWKQDGVTKSPGAQTAVAAGETTEVTAEPASGYYFQHNTDTDWDFTRNA